MDKIKTLLLTVLVTAGFTLVTEAYPERPIKKALTKKNKQNLNEAKICPLKSDATLNGVMRQAIAKELGFYLPSHRYCGYYLQSLAKNKRHGLAQEDIQVSADSASLVRNGRSHLKGHVEVLEADRWLSAGDAYIFRKNDKVTTIKLHKNVQLHEPGRLFVAEKACLNKETNSAELTDLLYRLALNQDKTLLSSHKRNLVGLNAWGRAKRVAKSHDDVYTFEHATYSTCSPLDDSWQIDAKKLTIDKKKQQAEIKGAVFRIKNTPIFYLPKFSFSLDDKRKSGFLAPAYGYTSRSGYELIAPYYFNLAPHYDATLSPHLYTERGLGVDGEVRYLFPFGQGQFNGSFLPHDKSYKQLAQTYNFNAGEANRYAIEFHHTASLNSHLLVALDYQGVSDDYYPQDFGQSLALSSVNQLLRRAYGQYTDEHWTLSALMQHYQTLHPVNQSAVNNVYSLYPDLTAQGSYYQMPLGLELFVDANVTRYDWGGANPLFTPEGYRYHVAPLLVRPFDNGWGYVTPMVSMQETYYDLAHYANSHREFQRVLPQYALDSGLRFERQSAWFGTPFTQTLEPRVFYLYTPFKAQQQIPVFDTTFNTFTYYQLFRMNRFAGVDRISNANQLTLALSSRFIDEQMGVEKLRLGVGIINYFNDRRVPLCQSTVGGCTDATTNAGYLSPTARYSPVAFMSEYHLTSALSVLGNVAWDTASKAANNGVLDLHYQPDPRRLVDLAYDYLSNGDSTMVFSNRPNITNLNQFRLSYAWPLTARWSSLGSVSYNMSHNYTMGYLLGVQYDSCCYALRLIGGRLFDSLSSNQRANYRNKVYLQVLFKGLGSVANENPALLINSLVPGYYDSFSTK